MVALGIFVGCSTEHLDLSASRSSPLVSTSVGGVPDEADPRSQPGQFRLYFLGRSKCLDLASRPDCLFHLDFGIFNTYFRTSVLLGSGHGRDSPFLAGHDGAWA